MPKVCIMWIYKVHDIEFPNIFVKKMMGLNPSWPNNFLTIEVFNELSHFDIFLHRDVLEIFNFNQTKVKTNLSIIHGINFENIDVWIFRLKQFWMINL